MLVPFVPRSSAVENIAKYRYDTLIVLRVSHVAARMFRCLSAPAQRLGDVASADTSGVASASLIAKAARIRAAPTTTSRVDDDVLALCSALRTPLQRFHLLTTVRRLRWPVSYGSAYFLILFVCLRTHTLCLLGTKNVHRTLNLLLPEEDALLPGTAGGCSESGSVLRLVAVVYPSRCPRGLAGCLWLWQLNSSTLP